MTNSHLVLVLPLLYSLCHSRRRKTLDVILLLWLCVVCCVEMGIFKTVLHVVLYTSCCHLVSDLGQLCGCLSVFVHILISFQTFRPTLSHVVSTKSLLDGY